MDKLNFYLREEEELEMSLHQHEQVRAHLRGFNKIRKQTKLKTS